MPEVNFRSRLKELDQLLDKNAREGLNEGEKSRATVLIVSLKENKGGARWLCWNLGLVSSARGDCDLCESHLFYVLENRK